MKVSVIIPVYNAESFISECIDSVQNQTYKNIEIILIDDGSTDKSLSICKSYTKDNGNIKVIHQENKGAAAARNVGISESRGNYLMFLDADDYFIEKDGLAHLVNIMNNNPEVEFCLFRMAYMQDKSKKVIRIYKSFDLSIFSSDKISIFEYLLNNNLLSYSASTQIIRSNYLKENKIFFENGLMCEDLDWILLLWQYANKIIGTNKVFYGYRQHSNSFSKKHLIKQTSDNLKIIKRWQTKEYDSEFKKRVFPFLADLLSSIYKNYFNTDRKYRESLITELKKLSPLLLYSTNKKSNRVKHTYKVFGTRMSLLIWGTYTWLKRKIIS